MPYIGTGVQDPNYFASEPGSIELEGGTYNQDRLYNSSTATVTGDITLTNNLVLARITDKGNNVTLTSDGTTRTITGSGKIESGNIVTTLPGNFTGMTGTIGSDVTFPTGMMIQITEDAYTAVANRGSTSFGAFTEYSVRSTISNCQSTSKIFISTNVCANGTNDLIAMFALYDVTNSQYVSPMGADGHFGVSIDANGRQRSISFQTLYTPPSYNSGTLIIELYTKGSSADNVRINQRGQGDAYARGTTNIILQEIAG